MNGECADDRLRQPQEIGDSQVNQVAVSAAIETDEFLVNQACVKVDGQTEQVSKRRHGAQFVFREQLA